jgi:hypothetical protein
MPRGVLSIWQMSNQLSRKFVNVDVFEVVELLSRGIEDSRANDHRDVDAMAVEYLSVHDWPPIVVCEGRQRLRFLVHDSEENRNLATRQDAGRQVRLAPGLLYQKPPI